MPYSFELKPRMSGTARACRAIVAARELDPALGEAALRALQLMHFTTPRLLDDDGDLRAALAAVPGLDADAIVASIDDPAIVAAYQADRALARSAEGSPTHAQDRFSTSDGPVRYTAPSVIFEDEDGRRLEVGGFQPFEAYDTALANLAVGLERRPAPADALEALREFPDGLTTAELASVMRPSDLVDADIEATAAELARAGRGGHGRARAGGPGCDLARGPKRERQRGRRDCRTTALRRAGLRAASPPPPPAALPPPALPRVAAPSRRAASRPAAKASPAPVLSTAASTGTASARTLALPSVQSAPSAPSVTTTSRKRFASALPARSGSRSPLSIRASSAFGSSRPAPAAKSRNSGDSRAADDGSTETVTPRSTARAIAARAAGREPDRSSA